MKFDLFYLLESHDHDYERAFDELLEQAVFAEEMGFDTIWLGEHHGSDYGTMPNPAVAAAAIAARTSRINIGTAVTNVTFKHPTATASDWAMVDNISHGRVKFGAGRGYQPREFRAFGIEDKMEDSREMFFEALECIEGLWTNERFTYHGKHFTIEDHELRPTVVQKPCPPIFAAAVSEASFKAAAARGYNLLMSPALSTMNELSDFAVEAKRTLLAQGRAPESMNFPTSWFFHVAETEAQAFERSAQYFGNYFAEGMKHPPQGAKVPKGYEHYAEIVEKSKTGPGLTLEDLRAGNIVFIGSPDQAIESLEELYDTMGLYEVMTWQRLGGMPHDIVMDSIRLTGEHVIPHFKDHPLQLPRALREEMAAGVS
jgi:alkanesulfonate monooxygenase SsuD/methylene tetrahydromethanopterin reductase-like flavin-dependent oxidoreductase (luciferase family)